MATISDDQSDIKQARFAYLAARKPRLISGIFVALTVSVIALAPVGCAMNADPLDELSVEQVHQPVVGTTWRSQLFPTNWVPGFESSQSRYLQDFSYAGYHLGEKEPPIGQGSYDYNVLDYGADPTGQDDSTSAIQAAIDEAGANGGGVIYLPAGTYKVVRPESKNEALLLNKSGVVLRGAGARRTRIYNAGTNMRSKSVIRVKGNGGWYPTTETNMTLLTKSVGKPTKMIEVASIANYAVGDWIVLRSTPTKEWFAEHPHDWTNLDGAVYPGTNGNPDRDKFEYDQEMVKGITFLRQITAINAATRTISIDIPTRYALKIRDSARIYKIPEHVSEVGLEGFSIGMRMKTGRLKEFDHGVEGTPAYDVHGAAAIRFVHAVNCWASGLETYRPHQNTEDFHVLSHALLATESRSLSILENTFSKPQYIGPSGNGYMFRISSADSLYRDNNAIEGRHNYSILDIHATGECQGCCRVSHAA